MMRWGEEYTKEMTGQAASWLEMMANGAAIVEQAEKRTAWIVQELLDVDVQVTHTLQWEEGDGMAICVIGPHDDVICVMDWMIENVGAQNRGFSTDVYEEYEEYEEGEEELSFGYLVIPHK